MSLSPVPAFHGNDCLPINGNLTSIQNQVLGDGLEERELLAPSNCKDFIICPSIQQNAKSSAKSEVIDDKEFKVFFNVSQFQPEELEVKIVGNFVVVHGKHGEKCDAHGIIAREFTRKYMLPMDCEQEKLTATLIPNDLLVIHAPKIMPPILLKEEINDYSKPLAEEILQKTEKIGDESDGTKERAMEISKKSTETCRLLLEEFKEISNMCRAIQERFSKITMKSLIITKALSKLHNTEASDKNDEE